MIRRFIARLLPPPAMAASAPEPTPAADEAAVDIGAEIDARIEAIVDARIRDRLGSQIDSQTRLVTDQGHPNINDLWRMTKDMEALRLNVKALGYELSRTLEAGLQSIPVEHARIIGLDSKPTTQADIEAGWCRSWCATLRERPRYHRRIWESAFVLQALFEGEALLPGAKVLALGPVDGSVISYLARNDVRSVAFAPSAPERRSDLADAFTFENNVQFVEQTQDGLKELTGFDACWSIGSAGRQGSIREGMDFILQTIDTLRPGGVAVHVFDFNFADDQQTIDNWPSALFQRRHIEALADELMSKGHAPRPLDFHVGHQPLDRFVDIPPFENDRTVAFEALWRDGWQGAHLKVAMDGFAATSFGLIVRRGTD